MAHWLRVRAPFFVLTLATIVIGLTVHLRGDGLSPATRDILGDALWAAMVVWGISALAPAGRWWVRGGVALAICWGVEFSQLIHAPALDALRATTAGHLVLGSGFDARDLLAYAAGVLVALMLDALPRRWAGVQRP